VRRAPPPLRAGLWADDEGLPQAVRRALPLTGGDLPDEAGALGPARLVAAGTAARMGRGAARLEAPRRGGRRARRRARTARRPRGPARRSRAAAVDDPGPVRVARLARRCQASGRCRLVTGPRRQYRYYDLVMASFVTVLLCADLIGPGKGAQIRPLTFGAGVLVFPISYIYR